MPVRGRGFETVKKRLKDVSRRAQALQGHQPALGELFPPSFMQKHTKFMDIEAMLKAGGFLVNSIENFKSIPVDQLDSFVAHSTKFQSWEAMQEIAAREWATGKLGLK